MTDSEFLIPRERYQRLLEAYRDAEQVKVLQGVRRCGKSAILTLYKDSLLSQGVEPRNIYYRRFDLLEEPLDVSAETLLQDVTQAWEKADRDNPFYVFLDEIQDVAGWEKVVRRLHSERGIDLYLTGSNAHILSSDLATLLAGRSVTIDVFPLSFREFVDFNRHEGDSSASTDELFSKFLRYGGMPSLFSLKQQNEEFITRELSSIFDTVLLNDVALRRGIRDIALLERLVTYLFSTSGNLFSTRKVVGALVSSGRKTSAETIDNYISALEKSFILHGVEQSGIAGKQVLSPLRKFYPVDTGLRNLSTRFSPRDLGFQLEDVALVELLRRGYDVRVGAAEKAEVDFVANGHDKRIYFQVTETMLDNSVYDRELAPLRAIQDSFPKMVLTLDRFRTGTTEDGILIANLIDWLLDR